LATYLYTEHTSDAYYSSFLSMIRPPPSSTLFPTRRSSDLATGLGTTGLEEAQVARRDLGLHGQAELAYPAPLAPLLEQPADGARDRKSTRLNSSHVSISYAVFCLKKKSAVICATSYVLNE